MKKHTRIYAFLTLLIVFLALQACLFNFETTGACLGYSNFHDTWYCNDHWTWSECNEYDIQQTNSADWTWHARETCRDLGY